MSVFRVVKKFSSVLSSHQKHRILELAVLMVIGGLLETFSVSLMLPFMESVMNPKETMERWYVKWVCRILHMDSPEQFLTAAAVILAAVYLLKNIYLLLQISIQYRFVYGNMFSMQQRLLGCFLNRPYEYYLHVNSGEMIRIINTDTPNTFELLSALLSLFTEAVVSGMLIVTVFLISPVVTVLIAAVLFVLLLMINGVLKPILRREGKAQQEAVSGMNKWLLQSIQGIKEIKVMCKERFFRTHFDRYGQECITSMRRRYILNITPRFVIEAVSMSTMFLAAALLISHGEDLSSIIPMLTAAAMAAVRLMPAVSRISSSLANISFHEAMLDKLIENLKDISGKENVLLDMGLSQAAGQPLSGTISAFQNDIRFEHISYRYPDNKEAVLADASVRIRCGESVGIVGPSGSGKTTAADVLLGLLHPQSGSVLIDGRDINDDMAGWLSLIGYIPQTIFMLDDTVRANIAFGDMDNDRPREDIWQVLKEASLDDFVRSLPDGLDTEIGERGVRLSGGQRQRIGIARALYRNPDILVFDEATSALDNATEEAVMESIRKLQGKKTMIIIAHRLTTLKDCDHIYRVENGKIIMER